MSRITQWLRRRREFRGEPPPLIDRLRHARVHHRQHSASQFGQDFWVLAETNFMRDGFFVEFGAQDGVSFSNTLLLEREFGWRGILAEANPRFRDHIGANRTAQTCGKCIYSETGRSIEFWDIPAYPGLSTSAEHASGDQYASQRGEAPNRVVVETISLNDLLTNFEAPPTIDYMSVDTEGSELEILAAFDFSKWQVRFMGIEYNTPEREIQLDAFMESLGYQRAFRQLSPVDGLYRRLPTSG